MLDSESLMPMPMSFHAGAVAAPNRTSQVCATGDEFAVAVSAASPPIPPQHGLPQDIAIGDWDELLSAVKARLKHLAGEPHAARLERPLCDAVGEARTGVLECVTALDQLQTTLTHELRRRLQLELEVFDVQTALAQARAELRGTQAGERRARHLAMHDSLTSLPNRCFFRQRTDGALAHSEPQRRALAVLYLDLDGFKQVNDTHGHDAGDQLLRIVAARLARAIRAEDMVSRLGGDEFACVLSDLPSREQLCHLAGEMFDAVSAPVKMGELSLSVRPSIGIAICPADGVTTDTLLKNADAAMYFAKRRRTGYAFFDQCADA